MLLGSLIMADGDKSGYPVSKKDNREGDDYDLSLKSVNIEFFASAETVKRDECRNRKHQVKQRADRVGLESTNKVPV